MGGTPSRERIAPPMLRLDVLDSILSRNEWVSPRVCSPHADVTLSAASTRASAHLTFRSARGATSRGSARHGSGRSMRTGRTTQRDSGRTTQRDSGSTGCPSGRSVADSVPADEKAAAAATAGRSSLPASPSSLVNVSYPTSCDGDGDGDAEAVADAPRPSPSGNEGGHGTHEIDGGRSPLSGNEGGHIAHENDGEGLHPSVNEDGCVTQEINGGRTTGFVVDIGGEGVPSERDAGVIAVDVVGGVVPRDAHTNPGLSGGSGRSARKDMPRLQLGELTVNEKNITVNEKVTTKVDEVVVGGGSHHSSKTVRQSDACVQLPLPSLGLGTYLLEPDAGHCLSETDDFAGDALDGKLPILGSATATVEATSSPHITNLGIVTRKTHINKLETTISPGDGTDKIGVIEPAKTTAEKVGSLKEHGGNFSEYSCGQQIVPLRERDGIFSANSCGSQPSNAPPAIEEPRTHWTSRSSDRFSRVRADKSPTTNLVFRLAYASAPPETRSSQSSKTRAADILKSEVAVAKLMASLLPLISTEKDAEEALAVALDMLSLVGTNSWTGLALQIASRSDIEAEESAKDVHGAVDDNLCQRLSTVWPEELDTVDMVLLARVARAYLDMRWSVVRSQFQGTSDKYRLQEMGSSAHRSCMHKTCCLVLECTWVTRLLFHRILSAGTLDGQFRSSLPTEMVTSLIRYCGRALEVLPGNNTTLTASQACANVGDGGFQNTPTPLEGGGVSADDGAELLLLTAPAVFGIVSSLTALLNQPAAWGEDLGWATATLASTDFCDRKGAILPVLVRLFERLAVSMLTGGHRQPAELEGGSKRPSSSCASPSADQSLTWRLPGATDALSELLVAVIQSLDAILRRIVTLVETSRETSPSRARRWHSEKAPSAAAAAVKRKVDDKGAPSDGERQTPHTITRTAVLSASDEVGTPPKTEMPSNDNGALGNGNYRIPDNTAVPSASDETKTVTELKKSSNLGLGETPTKIEKPASNLAWEEAVTRALREISPAFRSEGPVLAILNAQFMAPQSNGNREERDASRISSDKGGISTACLVATLHLSTTFFSVRGKSGDFVRDEKGDTRLEDYVAPIFSGFHHRRRCNRGVFEPEIDGCGRVNKQECERGWRVRRSGPGSKHAEEEGATPRDRKEGALRRDQEGVGSRPRDKEEGGSLSRGMEEDSLLCRLHLEALVELSLTADPAVHQELREQRVAQVLGQQFFGEGGATDQGEGSVEFSTSIVRPMGDLSDAHRVARPFSSRAVGAAPEKDSDFQEKSSGFEEPVRGNSSVSNVVATSAKISQDVPVEEATPGAGSAQGNYKTQDTPSDTPRGLPPIVSSHGTPCRDKVELDKRSDEGEVEQSIQPKARTGRAAPISAGDKVSGLFAVKSGRPRWFAGRVKRVNEDGTLHVCYDDGDEETNKSCAEVRPNRRGAGRGARPFAAARRVGENQVSGTVTPALRPGSNSEGDKRTTPTAGSLTPRCVKPGTPVAEALTLQDSGHRQDSMDATGRDRLASKLLVESELASSDGNTSRAPIPSRASTTIVESTSMAPAKTTDSGPGQSQGEVLLPAVGTGAVTEAGIAGVTVSTADGVEADQDSEEEDMYFVIPSVLEGATTAPPKSARQFCVAKTSVIPRIDLQSQKFRTRVHSSQLGPGSSLSTPTTGGVGRCMRGGGGGGGGGELRSERSIAAMFSDRPLSARQSSSPLTVPPNTVAVLPRTRGCSGMGAASIVAKVSPRLRTAPCKIPTVGSATEGVFSGNIRIPTASSVNGRLCSENAENLENPSPHQEILNFSSDRGSEPSRLSARSRVSECTCGDDFTPPAVAVADSGLVPTEEAAAAGGDKHLSGNPPEQAYRGLPCDSSPRPGTGVCAMRHCAIAFLLSVASTLGTSGVSTEPRCTTFSNLTTAGQWEQDHLLPGAMATATGKMGKEDLLADVMALLQVYFDNPSNAHAVLSLRTRWRGGGVSAVEAAPAVLAKLVCGALFDAKSYSLDGRHIAAGRSGGVIVSRYPLPFGEGAGWLARATPTESVALENGNRAEHSTTITPFGSVAVENGKIAITPAPNSSLNIAGTAFENTEREKKALAKPLHASSPLSSRGSHRRDENDGKTAKPSTNTLQTPSWPSSGSYRNDEEDEVALKVVQKDDLDRNLGPAVLAEVLALRALSGVPGVCRLYDFGVTLDSYVLVMERCLFSLKDWRVARGHWGENGDGGGGGGRGGDEGGSGGGARGRGRGRGRSGSGNGDDDDSGEETIGAPRSDEEAALYLLVFRQIASAVATMAERGVIHFDLKCDNVLVRGGRHNDSSAVSSGMGGLKDVPSVCVADFGESVIGQRRQASKPKSPVCGGISTGSESGRFEFDVRSARGTERIQSPEMILMASNSGDDVGNADDCSLPTSGRASDSSRGNRVGARRITTASDVWSLGCLLYEIITKQLLFQDLQWSEFFVTLTSGEIGVGRAAGAAGRRAPPKPLLPPPGTLPFDSLGSAKAIRALLESMLVRNPTDRPSASQTVKNIDKTLAVVVSESAKTSAGTEAGGAEACTSLSVNNEGNIVDKLTPRAEVSTSSRANAANQSVSSLSSDEKKTLSAQTPERCDAGLEEDYSGGGADAQDIPFPAQGDSRKTAGGRGATLAGPFSAAKTVWPLKPCTAALLHRSLAARQSALLGCAGILYPLGAGAFLLEINGPSDLGSRKTSSGAALGGGNKSRSGCTLRDKSVHTEGMSGDGSVLSAGSGMPGGSVKDPNSARSDELGRFGPGGVGCGGMSGDSVCDPSYARSDESGLGFGPGMMVGCAAGCNGFALSAGDNSLAGFTACPLGRVMPALGISHVVCVMPGREGQGEGRVARGIENPQLSSDKDSVAQGGGNPQGKDKDSVARESEDPQRTPSRVMDGSKLLCITIPVEDVESGEDAENGGGGENGAEENGDAVFSLPAQYLEDVLEFATGPRVLFVGREGTWDGASALAVAWTMARTGKGAYETVLGFRQSCVGFWVNPSALRSVIGQSS